MIELRHLRHLLALAHHGNFSRAAEELRLTQPALSRSIQSLEAQIGQPLFERNRSGIEPTDLGRVLLRHAEVVEAASRDLDRDLQLAQGLEIGELRIGMGTWAAASLAGPVLGQFNRLHPGVRMQVRTGHLDAMPDWLRRRDIDFAIGESRMFADNADFETRELSEHRLWVVCRSGHPLASRSGFGLLELGKYPLAAPRTPAALLAEVLQAALPSCAPDGTAGPEYQSPVKIECANVGILTDILLHSDALTFLPRYMFEAGLAAGQLVCLPHLDLGSKTRLSAVWLKQRTLSAAGRQFINLMAERDIELQRVSDRPTA